MTTQPLSEAEIQRMIDAGGLGQPLSAEGADLYRVELGRSILAMRSADDKIHRLESDLATLRTAHAELQRSHDYMNHELSACVDSVDEWNEHIDKLEAALATERTAHAAALETVRAALTTAKGLMIWMPDIDSKRQYEAMFQSALDKLVALAEGGAGK